MDNLPQKFPGELPEITSLEFFALAISEANKYQDTGLYPGNPNPKYKWGNISYQDLGKYISPTPKHCEYLEYFIHRDLPPKDNIPKNNDKIIIGIERKDFGKGIIGPPKGILRYEIKSIMIRYKYPEITLNFNLFNGGEIVGSHITTCFSLDHPKLSKIISNEHIHSLNSGKNFPHLKRARLEDVVPLFFKEIHKHIREFDAKQREHYIKNK
jgi:hypothetical protein